ncbi:hypothetical protein SDJN02_20779, partial [Cucurbita argyrosperma subsp. argyrosperma]
MSKEPAFICTLRRVIFGFPPKPLLRLLELGWALLDRPNSRICHAGLQASLLHVAPVVDEPRHHGVHAADVDLLSHIWNQTGELQLLTWATPKV